MQIISKNAFVRAAAASACLRLRRRWSVTALPRRRTRRLPTTPDVPAHAPLGTWGVDLTARDLSVKPGDDFQKYARATGSRRPRSRPTSPRSARSTTSYDLSQDQLKALITSAPADSKYGALYQSMMDEGGVEALGIEPLSPISPRSRRSRRKAEFARHMGTTDGGFGSALFALRPRARHRRCVDERRSTSTRPASACRTATIISRPSSSRSATPIAPISSARSRRSASPTRRPRPTA